MRIQKWKRIAAVFLASMMFLTSVPSYFAYADENQDGIEITEITEITEDEAEEKTEEAIQEKAEENTETGTLDVNKNTAEEIEYTDSLEWSDKKDKIVSSIRVINKNGRYPVSHQLKADALDESATAKIVQDTSGENSKYENILGYRLNIVTDKEEEKVSNAKVELSLFDVNLLKDTELFVCDNNNHWVRSDYSVNSNTVSFNVQKSGFLFVQKKEEDKSESAEIETSGENIQNKTILNKEKEPEKEQSEDNQENITYEIISEENKSKDNSDDVAIKQDGEQTDEEEKKDEEKVQKDDSEKIDDFAETYKYEDDSVVITAAVTEKGVIDENAEFVCTPINEKSEKYANLRAELAKFYETTEDTIEIYPYDVCFKIDEDEFEPQYGSVTVAFEFKKPIDVKKEEDAEVIHVKNNEEMEILNDNIVENGSIESFEIEMDSFSPVVVAKTNLGSTMLKSIKKTDTSGNEYYISKTPNINENGVGTGYYANSQNLTDVIECDGAMYLDVEVRYGGERVNWDWLYIKDANDNILTKDAYGNTVGSTLSNYIGRIGGGVNMDTSYTNVYATPQNTLNFRFETDTLKFVWRTDGSGQGYGYYAIITPVYSSTPVPDYHFEELEDGTYALVFDKGGDIESFLNNPSVKEEIAAYKDNISEIQLHKETKSVGQGAFRGLSSLKKVTMPRNPQLTTIGKNAFAGCDGLTEFTVPATVTAVDGSAFNGCTSLETFTFAEGSPITELSDGMFNGLASLKNVALPEGLTSIPDNFFTDCTSLTYITLPDTVASIGANAFKNTRLYEVPNLENVTTIGSMAFANNPNLKTVTIPANVTSIGTAFRGCTGITDFVFEEGTSFPTLPADFFQGMSKLKNVVLPSNLTQISNEMFKDCSVLEHIDIPSTVTSIGSNAFENCVKLQDFEIPSGVTTIGASAFKNCDSLVDMVIPATVKSVGAELFYGCDNLIRVQFEDNSPITTLPSGMFYGCKKLESVKLPDKVTAIPASYFRECTNLKTVKLPEKLTSIGDYAFYGCVNLGDLTFPNTLKTVGTYAFYNCKSLTDVVIPNSVTSFGSNVFQSCTSLKSLVFENGSPLTSIGTYLANGCSQLETLVLPEKLKTIPDYTAASCGNLKNVNMPSTVTSIGSYAFDGCSKLTSIGDIPDNCTTINSYAFRWTGLTSVELPEKLTTIGSYAFYNTKLESVVIPKNVTSINNYAFSSINTLDSVVFEENGKGVSVYERAFQSCPQLKEFVTNERLTYIGAGMLMYDRRLEEFVVDPKVTEIGGQAFNFDIGLKRLEIKASPTNTALKFDDINNSSYYNYTFGRLNSLEELIIDRDITSSYQRDSEFIGLNPSVHITIGEHVNNLDNLIVSQFTSDSSITFEGENDFTVTTRVPNQSSDVKWSELKGDFYVDVNGVLYKLNKTDGTASLFYIPDGITEYTVPETITSVAGDTYTVTKIESYAGRSANALASLTVETPSNVIIPEFAFTGCPSLQTINGKTELYTEEWNSVSLLCDFPIYSEQMSTQVKTIVNSIEVEEGNDAAFSFAISVTNQESVDENDQLTNIYPTGRSARVDIAVSNESNLDMSDRVIRIYFAFTGENYTLGNYPVGNYTLVNTVTGAKYPLVVHTTDAAGVYYYDISGFKPGDTLAFNNQLAYTSPTSGGGDLIVWAENISADEAQEREGKTSQPTEYIKSEWYTKQTPYTLSKTTNSGASTFSVNTKDETDDDIYVTNLAYTIKLTSQGEDGTSYAKDYIKYIDMYDDVQLNENMMWNPDIVEAINNGDYYYDSSSTPTMYAYVNGRWVNICTFSWPSAELVRNVRPTIVEDNNGNPAVRINWSYRNTYWSNLASSPTANLPAISIGVTIGNESIQVKEDSDLWKMLKEGEGYSSEVSQSMRSVSNKVHNTSHYSYGKNLETDAQSNNKIVTATTGFRMEKTMNGSQSFGLDHKYNISLINTGLVNRNDIDKVYDPMNTYYYIKADEMEKMFSDEKWGPFLRVDMEGLTLCVLPNKSVVDIYGNEFTITDAQYSGVDPIPYSGLAAHGTDASELQTSMRFAIYWDETYSHKILEVQNNDKEVQATYTIGNSCNYNTIDDAFKALGYVVTASAKYSVTWDLHDKYTLYRAHLDGVEAESISDLTEEQIKKYEYLLRSGRTDTFTINSSVKRTDMLLNDDREIRYSNSSIYNSNTAYARDNTERLVGSASWNGYISSELTLNKNATVDGQNFTSGQLIPDDSIVDYTLSFTNSGDKYDVLPLTDKMGGAQVLLVPVRTNKNAMFYAKNSEEGIPLQDSDVEIYTSGGVEYYILDKTGTYKDVVIDGRTADSIIVSRANGAAETLMIWYYQNLTGATSSVGSTSKSIKYKALADSSRLGAKQEDEYGSTVTQAALSNESWLGGHQTHRLYAALSGKSEQMQFIKNIVENPESARENLINHSLIENGNEVLYKIRLENTGNAPATITGNRISDSLPETKGVFEWSKDNVLDVYYVADELGSSVETIGDEYWYIDAINPLTGRYTSSNGQYYIHWTDDFNMVIGEKSEAWIYVKLKFPASDDPGDKWNNYIALNNGAILKNTFSLDNRDSSVTHELVDVVEGMLQKGVLDSGLSSSGKFQSEDTRNYYQNGSNTLNGSAQEIAYYTVIYNSGNVRLYLDKLEDQLPKGFKFRALFNGVQRAAMNTSTLNTSSSSPTYATLGIYNSVTRLNNTEYFGSTNSTYMPVATVHDENRNSVTYKSASVDTSVSTDSDGHQQITFTIGNIKYDSELKKYYLEPGEAVRFGYMCTVEGYARTENVANNEIAMPVYDKYGLGIYVSDGEKVQVNPASYRDIALNDGTCELKTTDEETVGRNHIGQPWVRGTTEWFSSNVSVQRLVAVPGVQKTIGGESYLPATQQISPSQVYGSKYSDGSKTGSSYIGTVNRTSIVNWTVRVYNEGGVGSNSMEDYTIVDTVDSPYRFTGNFFYDYYNLNGTKITSSSVPIFSLGGRTEGDTVIPISAGSGSNTLNLNGTITVNGDPVLVDDGRASVQLLRDQSGVETIIIKLIDNTHRVPPNSYMELVCHTQYVSSEAVLSKQFYNHVQLEPSVEFEPSLVSQGKVLYKDEDGEDVPYAIESGASITMTAGYTSAARKQVTQMDRTSNTAWSDGSKTSIQLPDKFTQFYYDMYVDLPEDDLTQKIVMIDALPEPGDHSPFVERDTRDSEFVVRIIGDNPGIRVWSSENLGRNAKTELTTDQYTFEVTTRHEFTSSDWDGAGDGWTTINLSDGIDATEANLISEARAIRIIIEDEDLIVHPEEAIMNKNSQVQVRFNAEIESPEDADPGAYAWNSFGYRYTVPIGATGMSTSLNAEPLKVGISLPAVPYIVKDQKTPHNHYKAIDEDSSYQFLIYTGSAIEELNDLTEKNIEEIVEILATNSRNFMMAEIPVEAGESTGKTDYFDEEKKWTLEGGQLQPTSENWTWVNSAKYTILELPWEENGFKFSDIQHSPVNNYTFTQNTSNTIILRVTNVYKETGRLKIQKTVQGPSFDTNKKFTFTIRLKDGRHPAYGTYRYVGTNISDGGLTFDDSGTASIQLKHGQAIELVDIPSEYTYSVTEAEDALYSMGSTNESGTIPVDDVAEVSFVNTRKDTELSISKTVTGNFGNRNKMFDFEVYIVDEGRELAGRYNAVITKAGGGQSSKTLNFVDGAVVVQLQHGDKITISGLPVGARYEVDELVASKTGYTTTATNESGTLTEDGITSAWTNNKNVAVPTRIPFNPLLGLIISLGIIGTSTFILREKRRRKT